LVCYKLGRAVLHSLQLFRQTQCCTDMHRAKNASERHSKVTIQSHTPEEKSRNTCLRDSPETHSPSDSVCRRSLRLGR
jgi:hypothetical protein